jgi:(2Fe-2S) ferredoxin
MTPCRTVNTLHRKRIAGLVNKLHILIGSEAPTPSVFTKAVTDSAPCSQSPQMTKYRVYKIRHWYSTVSTNSATDSVGSHNIYNFSVLWITFAWKLSRVPVSSQVRIRLETQNYVSIFRVFVLPRVGRGFRLSKMSYQTSTIKIPEATKCDTSLEGS